MTSGQGHAEFIVPVDWWGALEYGYQRAHYDPEQDTSSNSVTARLGNRSYIWYPWFATMKLGLGLSRSNSSGDDYNNDNTLVTGSADLNILPLSRFPFSVAYERSDSRIDNSSFSNDEYFDYGSGTLTREKWRFNQRLIGDNYKVNLYHNRQNVSDVDGEEQESIGNGIEYSLRGKGQMLNLKALETTADGQNGAQTEHSLLSARHSLDTSDGLSNNLLVSRTETQQSFSEESSNDYHLTRIRQAANNTLWRSADRKLAMNLGLRAYETETGNASSTQTTEGTSASAGASYRYSKNILFTGTGSYSLTNSESSDSEYRSASLGGSYNSDPSDLGDYQYKYFLSSNFKFNDNNGEEENSADLTGGHSLSRSISLSKYSTFRITGNQSLSVNYVEDEEGEDSDSYAGHSLSLGWMKSATGGNSSLQLALNDRRSLQHEDVSQMANLQLSRRQSLSRRATLGGNASYNWNAREESSTDTSYVTESAHAMVDYEYQRPFQLQNIRFRSSLKHTLSTASEGDDQSKTFFDNRLMHHIGKLDTTLSLSYTEQNSTTSYMLWLKIKRTF